eukprot:13268916-Alexandrium_andersonii.AAC.1
MAHALQAEEAEHGHLFKPQLQRTREQISPSATRTSYSAKVASKGATPRAIAKPNGFRNRPLRSSLHDL